MNSFLSHLDWRFATKKFDPLQKVSAEDFAKIQLAIQQTPTSFGLQTFHVIVVSDNDMRQKLRQVSFNQPQVTDASHLLIFCARNDVSQRITNMIDQMSHGDEESKKNLAGYESMMRSMTQDKNQDQLMNWASRQAYIALGFALAACAELRIDSCPMEGFDPQAMHKVLGLPEHIFPFAYLAVGYRAEEPQHPKFRFSQEDLFTQM